MNARQKAKYYKKRYEELKPQAEKMVQIRKRDIHEYDFTQLVNSEDWGDEKFKEIIRKDMVRKMGESAYNNASKGIRRFGDDLSQIHFKVFIIDTRGELPWTT